MHQVVLVRGRADVVYSTCSRWGRYGDPHTSTLERCFRSLPLSYCDSLRQATDTICSYNPMLTNTSFTVSLGLIFNSLDFLYMPFLAVAFLHNCESPTGIHKSTLFGRQYVSFWKTYLGHFVYIRHW